MVMVDICAGKHSCASDLRCRKVVIELGQFGLESAFLFKQNICLKFDDLGIGHLLILNQMSHIISYPYA